MCGLQQLGTEGSSKGLDSGRGHCASGPDSLADSAPGVRSGEVGPLRETARQAGAGDAGATDGGTRQKAHQPHTVPSQPQPHAGPILLQGFRCGQTDSCPHVAGILLRGEDKNQVNTKRTG